MSTPTTWSVDRDANPASAAIFVLGDSLSCIPSPYSVSPNCWTIRAGWEWPSLTNRARSGSMPQDLIAGASCVVRSSWYTDWGAGVMAELAQKQPSLVIVALGTVNYGFIGQHPTDYMIAMRALCDSIRQLSPRSTILLVHEPGYRASHGLTWIWVQYGQQLDAYAATLPNAGYLDLARDLPWADSDTSGAFADDRVHLNNAGQVMMAVAIIGRLRWL